MPVYIPVLDRQREEIQEPNPLLADGLCHTDLARTETRSFGRHRPRWVWLLPGEANAVSDILSLHLDEFLP